MHTKSLLNAYKFKIECIQIFSYFTRGRVVYGFDYVEYRLGGNISVKEVKKMMRFCPIKYWLDRGWECSLQCLLLTSCQAGLPLEKHPFSFGLSGEKDLNFDRNVVT